MSKAMPKITDPDYAINYLNTYYRIYLEPPQYIPMNTEALQALRDYVTESQGIVLTNRLGALEAHHSDSVLTYGDVFGGAELVLLQ